MNANQIEPTPKQVEFITSTTKYSCFSGGFGCVAGETKVFDPLTGKHCRMDSLSGAAIYAYYQGRLIPAFATRPKQYKKKNLYKVKTVRGNTILVTKQHRFQTRSGWKTLSQIKISEDLLVSAGFHPLTILAFSLSVLFVNVQNFWKRVEDWRDRCFAYLRQKLLSLIPMTSILALRQRRSPRYLRSVGK